MSITRGMIQKIYKLEPKNIRSSPRIFISKILYLWSLETKDSDVNYSPVVFKRPCLHNMLERNSNQMNIF